VYDSPSVTEIKQIVDKETEKLWHEVLRFENPHNYYVDLSTKLWSLKHNLINKYSNIYMDNK